MVSTGRRIASIAIAVALLTAPVLSGCANSPIQGSVESSNGAEVDLGGANVPDDFPAKVPLIDGEVLSGGSIGNDQGKVWNVSVRVDDASALSDIELELADAGFETRAQASGENGGTLISDNDDEFTVLVVVSRDGSDFVANYTVTSKAA